MFKKLKSSKVVKTALCTLALCLGTFSMAFADGTTPATTPDVSSTMSSSFQTIVTQTLQCVAAIAPIGITIFAAFFCWKKGMSFFKTITTK